MSPVRKFFVAMCAGALLVSCDREEAAYAGKSAHWDQQQVPESLKCAACHTRQFEEWAGSDHAWAWRMPDAALDSEPFHRQKLSAHGATLSFNTTPQGGYRLQDAAGGAAYEVHSIVGRTPLVQYLVRGKDGGLQAPSAAWDVERHEWFDLFAQDERLSAEGQAQRASGDWGHWLGRGMNWNSQCAWCHMTCFHKNYHAEADTYSSAWQEPGVTCLQCHRQAPEATRADGCLVRPQDRKLTAEQVHDNCASCHARREELDENFRAGEKFDDHFRLELPILPGIFWPNGMQRDESYCETGLRLSRMGAAGVTCLDCHDPHTARLKLPQEDNSLCLRCHADGTEVNGTPAPIITHAPEGLCPQESMGGRCVECHMPASPYMARDMRRDHSFNIPDPTVSVQLGVPNACTMCHRDKTDEWAADALKRALPEEQKAEPYRLRTHAVYAAMNGQGITENLILALQDEKVPAWRATLLELLSRQPAHPDIDAAARKAAGDESPMVRAAAARILGMRAPELLEDPVRLVRHAAAWRILLQSYEQLKLNSDDAPAAAEALRLLKRSRAMKEIEETARHQADQPVGAMQLASLAAACGEFAEAERQYERAIALDPASPVPYMDYAVYLAGKGKPLEALKQMLACTKAAPQNAEAQYRLALILVELKQYTAAHTALERAVQADPTHAAARATLAELRRFLSTGR